jgi:hypothetical protein
MGRFVLLMCAMWRVFPEQIVSKGDWNVKPISASIIAAGERLYALGGQPAMTAVYYVLNGRHRVLFSIKAFMGRRRQLAGLIIAAWGFSYV